MRVCVKEYRSSIEKKKLSSGPCAACNTGVNAMHLYSFEDPAFPFFTFFLATPADSCNYLYSFSFLLFITFLLATRECRSP